MPGKKILLIEPGYKNKYPPLGLMKIAQYHGPNGKKDFVRFVKGCDTSVLDTCWDRIYVTTLFSFEWKRIAETIDFAIEASGRNPSNVFVGGIAASLMHELPAPAYREPMFSPENEDRLQQKFWTEFPVELTEAQRRTLWLYGRHGLTLEEISKQIGVPRSTVHDWIQMGRERLHDAMNAQN
jgi:predicted DNA-binding protein (UPF0251 family)